MNIAMSPIATTQDYTRRGEQLANQLREGKAFETPFPIYGSIKKVNTIAFEDMDLLPKKPYTKVQYPKVYASSAVPWFLR